MVKNNIEKFLLIYAIILSAIDLFIIIFLGIIPVKFYFSNSQIVSYIILGFMIMYFIELIISAIIVFDRHYITRNNLRRILPQIIISLFYLVIFIIIIFILPFVMGLSFLLMAVSLFFSHLFVTGYLENTKIIIFWKIMSLLNSLIVMVLFGNMSILF